MNRLLEHHSSNAAFALATERIDIPHLRSHVKGQVITPVDPSYEQARAIFYGGFDHRPEVIVRPVSAADISHVVSLARESGVELAVRSGGHSFAGHSLSNGGIVLDLRDMRALQIDPADKKAWAETGLTTGEYTQAANACGLATGFGDTRSVGIGGITLGGGIGYLVRKHGLTIDSLLAAEVVTADGRLLRVDADNHPDLFWAIRGGGGNFGVATRFQFRLHEVDTVLGGMLILPAAQEVIADFVAEAQAAPEELSTIANIGVAPPLPFIPEQARGRLSLMVSMIFAGDLEAGERAVAPFRSLATPIADLVRPMRYPEIYPLENEGFHPLAAARTLFVDRIDRNAAEKIVEHVQASGAPMHIAQIRVLGGAMARVPVEATAFAHRQCGIMVTLMALYEKPEDRPAREKWLTGFATDLQQGYSGAYVNFLGDEGKARIRDAYPGATWDRLAAVKARYDPTNLFRRNHNILPARDQ